MLKKISEGVREFGLSWRQILQYRQMYVGGVDITVRHLLFTLRQRLQPQNQAESSHKQVKAQFSLREHYLKKVTIREELMLDTEFVKQRILSLA